MYKLFRVDYSMLRNCY